MNRVPLVRRKPILTWLVMLGLTVAAYLGYAAWVVPWMGATPVVSRSKVDIQEYRPFEETNDHHRWFAEGDWERQPNPILHTSQGLILFSDYEVEDPKNWLVKPFSLVLQREQPADQSAASPTALPPLVLRCRDGARLTFDRPVLQSSSSSSSNRLQSAFLQGPVELYRYETEPGQNDGIRIETSNVRVTDQQILTIDDVAFRFGPHHGSGRNLVIELAQSDSDSPGDLSAVKGVRKLELARLKSLHLEAGAAKDHGRKQQESTVLAPGDAPIRITAAGPFELDLQNSIARFIDRVHVQKLDPFKDTLQCSELLLEFASETGSNVFELDSAMDAEFELKSITAAGRVNEPAVLLANSQKTKVAGELLEYELARQWISASGSDRVEVTKEDTRFVARSIAYRLADDNRLGELRAVGPGQIVRDSAESWFRATWNDQLAIRRISDQQHAIRLNGKAHVMIDRETSIRANELQLAIWEVPVFGQKSELAGWDYQPAELSGLGNVDIRSDQMVAETDQLTAIWPDNPQASRQAPLRENRIGGNSSPPRISSRMQTSLVAKTHVVLRAPMHQQPPRDEKRLPLNIFGQQINAKLKTQDDSTDIVEIDVAGEISVSRPGRKLADANDFTVSGDRLKLLPVGDEQYRIDVAGSQAEPAMVDSEKMKLIGPSINLDQSSNTVWVNGAGQMILKGEADVINVDGTREIAQNQSDFRTQTANVAFAGGMVFDGQSIYFERQVNCDINQPQPNGAKTVTKAHGEALSLRLNRRIDLSRAGDSGDRIDTQRPAVASIVLLDRVSNGQSQFQPAGYRREPVQLALISTTKWDPSGKLVERIQIRSPKTDIDTAAGTMLAWGTGMAEITRAGGRPIANRRQLAVAENAESDGFTLVRAEFSRQMLADSGKATVELSGDLKCDYAIVDTANQYDEFKSNRDQRLPADSIHLNCQRIFLERITNQFNGSQFHRFTATGKTQVRSETFETAAEKIRYDQENDLLVIDGNNRSTVTLRHRRDVRSPWQSLTGTRLKYRPSDQWFDAENVGQISATLNKGP